MNIYTFMAECACIYIGAKIEPSGEKGHISKKGS
jgi:hypothetical protein